MVLELIEMAVRPSESLLDGFVKFGERKAGRDNYLTPYGRFLDVPQLNSKCQCHSIMINNSFAKVRFSERKRKLYLLFSEPKEQRVPSNLFVWPSRE
jgi:hypothetical protein